MPHVRTVYNGYGDTVKIYDNEAEASRLIASRYLFTNEKGFVITFTVPSGDWGCISVSLLLHVPKLIPFGATPQRMIRFDGEFRTRNSDDVLARQTRNVDDLVWHPWKNDT